MTNLGKSTSRSSTLGKQRIQRLLDNPPSHETIRSEVLLAVDDGNIQIIRELGVGDQERFLEIVDQAAPLVFVKDTEFVATLGDISSDILRLPNSTGSLQGLEKRGEIAISSGGTTDIWRGAWNNQQVALKAFRVYPPQELQEAKKILWKLAPIWKRLVHENILPFHGVDTSIFQLALVYDWGHNGNITQYLGSHPDVSRPELLLQVAKGLQYLHSLGIVHGDLKGANVLISETGKAQICEYGLNPIISDPTFTIMTTSGSSRWLAPEIINPPSKATSKPPTASKPADVFAFAMITVEVFTGRVPFGDVGNTPVAIQIVGGKRPAKPQAAEQLGLTAEMWEFIGKCWTGNPNERPTIDEVVRTWEGFIKGYPVPSIGSSANQCITSRDDSRISVPKASGHHSQFVEPSTVHIVKPELSPRKKRFCGIF